MDQLLTPGEVAELCQLSTKTVLRAIHAGRLRASRLGERAAFRVRLTDVETWIEASVLPTPPPVPALKSPAPAAPLGTPVTDIETGRLVLTPEMGRSSSPRSALELPSANSPRR